MQPERAYIDVHTHILPSFYCEAAIANGHGPSISSGFPKWSPQLALETMDRLGVIAQINSISQPGVHFGDDGEAKTLARRCNDYMALVKVNHPGRFGGLAVLPLPDVASACAEIDHALGELRLDGVGLLASYGQVFLSDPRFEAVLATLDRHRAVVLIHPNSHPLSRDIQPGLAGFLLEFPIDTTRAATGLLFSGALDRYRNIRFILAHAGGALPYLSWRLSLASLIDPRYAEMTSDKVAAGLRRYYFDLVQASGPQVLSCLKEVTTPDRILFGSDWPYCPEVVGETTIRSIADHESPSMCEAIFRQNAHALFPEISLGPSVTAVT